MTLAGGPAQLVLTAAVARRYYLEDASKVQIAEEYGLSRFQVARLLDRARATGLVKIAISAPGAVDVDLSSRLQRAYGLQHAVVVDTPENEATALRRDLGEAAAALLTEIVTANDVLGLAWSRSVSAMATALTHLLPVPVVQLTGALARSDVEDSSVELVRRVGRTFGGPAYFFYAPTIVPDAATARALRRIPEVDRTMRQFSSVTKAVVGVGLWAPTESTVYDATEEDVRTLFERHGQVNSVKLVNDKDTGRPRGFCFVEMTTTEAQAAIAALRPVIDDKDKQLGPTLDARFKAVDDLLETYRSGDGFKLYTELTPADTKKMTEVVDAVAEPVSKVAGVVTS